MEHAATMGLEERLAALSPRKRALYEQLLQQKRAQKSGRGPKRESEIHDRIPRLGPEEPHPLSFAQERMWFFYQLEPESPGYNVPSLLRLVGQLDAAALCRSLTRVTRRQGSLRTTFVIVDGGVEQRLVEIERVDLPRVELSGLKAAHRLGEARRLLAREARRSFDLVAGPVWRAMLVSLASDEHLLYLGMHHILSDGWSMGVLIRELAAFYAEAAGGPRAQLPELPVQYVDYAAWQRRLLESGALERQTAYWREKLEALPPRLELPTDRPRPAVMTMRGATLEFSFSARTRQRLLALARHADTTLFVVLLAIFKVLLARQSGQLDLAVGSPIANRRRTEIEGLIGFFVNTLVLRDQLHDDPPFDELLNRVRQTALGAYDHQDLPFERLVEALAPRRDVSHTPLFQVMFVLQNVPRPEIALPGLQVAPMELAGQTSQFDLTLLTAEEADGTLAASLEYNTDLFDRSTIERLRRQFSILMEGALDQPERRLSRLPVLGSSEWHQLMVEWNDTHVSLPGDPSMPALLAAAMEPRGDAIAAVSGEHRLSFAELARRGRLVARRLRDLGARPGDIVAVGLPRTLELLVTLWGAVEAGTTWLPLDPEYPGERLAQMLADARPRILVRDRLLRRRTELALPESVAVLELDRTPPAAVTGAGVATPGDDPELPAYMIYTSGSTGRPKAVTVPQRALAHHCRALARRFAMGPGDAALQFVSIGFDVSVQEILPTWTSGATVVLKPADLPGAADGLLRFVERQRLSIVNLPTSYWNEWVTALGARRARVPPSLRVLIVGTEQTLMEPWRRWEQLAGDRVRLINGYGPTETTIEASYYEPRGEDHAFGTVPIGRPFENMQGRVLDRHFRPVPVGVSGELAIGGAGVSRGYHRRPALTARAFVPDPWGAPGARLYRSGDLVRVRPNGHLECLGRVDRQVKIRGFRVELGDCEAALAAHPAVREAAVVARNGNGANHLVGYLVGQGKAPEAATLRRDLQEILPDYMVPGVFVVLDALPKSPNGKVDRSALETAVGETLDARTEYEAPRDELERDLVRIWKEVLGRERVGVHDNFFDLGGHSLALMRVESLLAERTGYRASLLEMFRHPTIRALVRHLEEKESGAGEPAPSFEKRFERGERRTAALAQQRQFRRRSRHGRQERDFAR